MKKIIIICASALILLISCGDKKTSSSDTGAIANETASLSVEESDNKTATFTVDGAEFKGKISTQHFGGESENYSVLCQQDEPFALLQAVFANEKEATGNAILKPVGSSYYVQAGVVSIALSGTAIGESQFIATDASTGTISVEGKKLVLKDLKLFNSDKKEKVVTATLPF